MALVLTAPGHAYWPTADWTVLAYLDGEGTLEECTLTNVAQMMKVGSTSRVTMVALVDRPGVASRAEATPPIPDWNGARLLKVERNQLEQLEDWGPTNTADPASLERFIKTAVARFPARRYLLVIGDHGLAWAGVCQDQDGRDRLTLPELAGALTRCRGELAGRLELIGMDACLMATVEVAAELAGHARLLVASEEAAPTDGWRYDQLLEDLDARPEVDATELARSIVDTYRKQFDAASEDRQLREALGVTMSVVDLPRMALVTQALDALAAAGLAQLAEPDGFDALARARAQSAAFGGSERTDTGSEMFDLCDLTEQLRSGPAARRPAMLAALDRLDVAARAAVVHNMSGRARSDARGLAVFWPETAQGLEDDDARYADLALARSSRWGAFLRAFGELRHARTAAVKVTELALSAPTASRAQPVTVTGTLAQGAPEAIWLGLYGAPVTLGTPQTPGTPDVLLASRPMDVTTGQPIAESFDGRWLMVTEGKAGFPADIADFEDLDAGEEEVLMNLPAQLCRAGDTRWQDIGLRFYLELAGDEPKGELAFVVSHRPGAPDVVRLKAGDKLRPVLWTIEEDGKVKRREPAPGAWEITLKRPRDLGLRMRPVPSGRYGLGVVTRDAADRWQGRPLPVRVR